MGRICISNKSSGSATWTCICSIVPSDLEFTKCIDIIYLLLLTTGTLPQELYIKENTFAKKIEQREYLPTRYLPQELYTGSEGIWFWKTGELTWCKGQHVPACSANKLLDPGNCHQLKQYASRLEQEKLRTVQLSRKRKIKVFRIIR